MAAGSGARADSRVWGQRGQKTAAELWGGVSGGGTLLPVPPALLPALPCRACRALVQHRGAGVSSGGVPTHPDPRAQGLGAHTPRCGAHPVLCGASPAACHRRLVSR